MNENKIGIGTSLTQGWKGILHWRFVHCTVRPLKMRQSHCLETSGANHPLRRRYTPEEQRPQLHCCDSLKTHRINFPVLMCFQK